jgi:hypothetical protein
MDEVLRWPLLERNVEEDLTDRRIALSSAELVRDAADALVARTRQPECLGDSCDLSVRLGNRPPAVIDVRSRGNELSTEPRGRSMHSRRQCLREQPTMRRKRNNLSK